MVSLAIALAFSICSLLVRIEMASSKRKADDVPIEINSDTDDEAGDGEFNENMKTRITQS
jgi:hypothetical protein